MICEVHLTKRAVAQIEHFMKEEATMILGWLASNIQGSNDPKILATPILGGQRDYLLYQIGRYCIYCIQDDDSIVVISIEIDNTIEV